MILRPYRLFLEITNIVYILLRRLLQKLAKTQNYDYKRLKMNESMSPPNNDKWTKKSMRKESYRILLGIKKKFDEALQRKDEEIQRLKDTVAAREKQIRDLEKAMQELLDS